MDRALILAHGKALALIATVLDRAGVVPATELGALMGLFSDIENDLEQQAILSTWADLITEAGDLKPTSMP